MHERVANHTRQALALAQAEARALGEPTVGPAHLLLALVKSVDEVTANAFAQVGITAQQLQPLIPRHRSGPSEFGTPTLSEEAKQVLSRALRDALNQGDRVVEPHHLLLAVVDDEDPSAASLVNALGVSRQSLVAAVLDRRFPEKASDAVAQTAQLDAMRDLFGPSYPLLAGLPAMIRAELKRSADEGDVMLTLAATDSLVTRALQRLGVGVSELRDALDGERQVPAPPPRDPHGLNALGRRRAELRAACTDAAVAGDYGQATALRDELRQVQAIASDQVARQDRDEFRAARARLGLTITFAANPSLHLKPSQLSNTIVGVTPAPGAHLNGASYCHSTGRNRHGSTGAHCVLYSDRF